MITGEYAIIRSTDADDAPFLQRLYAEDPPRSSLLDRKRELIAPTLDELRELLGRKEANSAALMVVEDREGQIQGFCGLRIASPDLSYAEAILMLYDEVLYSGPLALETFAYLCQNAFVEKRLNKVLAHCLVTEHAWRAFLVERGFACDGRQREVFYTGGQWHDMESYSMLRATFAPGA